MPTSAEILATLTAITHDLALVAIGWHVALLLVGLALILGVRFAPRVATLALAAPAASVAIAAFAYGNPFNGIAFALLAIGLVLSAAAPHHEPPSWALPVGVAAIVYGATYPHFVAGPWFTAFVAAPVGLVPCPTLAVLGGFALLAPSSRATSLLLAVWAAFYAAFGIARLGVWLDLGLAIVAVAAFARSVRLRQPSLAPA